MTSKNVGDLSVKNAQPVSFNHLTGNFTEALTSSGGGGRRPDRILGWHADHPSRCCGDGQRWTGTRCGYGGR